MNIRFFYLSPNWTCESEQDSLANFIISVRFTQAEATDRDIKKHGEKMSHCSLLCMPASISSYKNSSDYFCNIFAYLFLFLV